MQRGTLFLLLVGILAACGSTEPEGTDAGTPDGGSECVVDNFTETATSANHLTECSTINYGRHPPSIGDHYPRWATFRTYGEPVPTGFLVHAMEHGAVVLLYNCPSGCADVLEGFSRQVEQFPDDPQCSGVSKRFIIAPDPTLDTMIAALGWGRVYKADCLDEGSLETFIASAYRGGPEDLCVPGVDLSATGWCP